MREKRHPKPDKHGEFQFFRTSLESKVHVYAGRESPFGSDDEGSCDGVEAMVSLSDMLVALCGRRGKVAERLWTESFPDDDLCFSCVMRVAKDVRAQLFIRD